MTEHTVVLSKLTEILIFFFFLLSQSLQILFYSQGEILWSSNDDQFQGSELNPQVKEGNLIVTGF